MEGIRHRKRNDEDKTCSGDTGNSDVGERKESAKTSRLDDVGSKFILADKNSVFEEPFICVL